MFFLMRFSALLILLAFCSAAAQAQDNTVLARELVNIKNGYAEKKREFEELRIRAYIPILLKAVGKGPAWKPGHPMWAETERRIAGEWRKLYAGYLARVGRGADYSWMNQALAREYARAFTADELAALLKFYRSPAGAGLIAAEREFLGFYRDELLRSLARVMFGHETLPEREQQFMHSRENRERRDFITLFEIENILHEEALRIGSAYVRSNSFLVQLGAITTGASAIDALRRKLDSAALAELNAFVKSELGRKERAFITAAVPTSGSAPEDPAQTAREEAAFYKELAQLSARWRELASKNNQ